MKKNILFNMDIEKRRFKRKFVSLESTLFFDGKNYNGYVENICECGLHIIAASKNKAVSFIPEAIIQLEFQPSTGKTLNLQCEVRWVHINKTPVHGFTYRMGMDIVNQPAAIKNILTAFSHSK